MPERMRDILCEEILQQSESLSEDEYTGFLESIEPQSTSKQKKGRFQLTKQKNVEPVRSISVLQKCSEWLSHLEHFLTEASHKQEFHLERFEMLLKRVEAFLRRLKKHFKWTEVNIRRNQFRAHCRFDLKSS